MNKHTISVKQFIKNETVFCAAAALAALSCLAVKPGREYLGYIDYRTLALLFWSDGAGSLHAGNRCLYHAGA